MDCQIEKNLKTCSCSYPDCPRKGKCCECIKYHREKSQLPACYFSPEIEKTYDRSVIKFLQTLD